ncbi:hypothetical protein BC830DRAFT_1136274 [Chytriomyces sp. MP71]|nr:hypothetical protein BC830DRAFT_1136274 [Chytriomyces sp. MP71]
MDNSLEFFQLLQLNSSILNPQTRLYSVLKHPKYFPIPHVRGVCESRHLLVCWKSTSRKTTVLPVLWRSPSHLESGTQQKQDARCDGVVPNGFHGGQTQAAQVRARASAELRRQRWWLAPALRWAGWALRRGLVPEKRAFSAPTKTRSNKMSYDR